jgi:hypothetical protein
MPWERRPRRDVSAQTTQPVAGRMGRTIAKPIVCGVRCRCDRMLGFAAVYPSYELESVLVDIPSRRVEPFRRTPDQAWPYHEHRPDLGDGYSPALGVSIPFDEIFENVVPERLGYEGEA